MPYVIAALGSCFFREATACEDQKEGTDLRFVGIENAGRIAVRVRRAHYRTRYMGQVTLRAGTSTGAKTELAKLLGGEVLADWFFYGFAGAETARGISLSAWVLIDMQGLANGLRDDVVRYAAQKSNTSDGTHFVAIDTHSLWYLGLVRDSFNWTHGTVTV